MENREGLCRFCLEICDTNFKTIEGSTHEILNMLQVTINIAITVEPVMCTNCSETLQNCFVFKKTCLDARGDTVALGNDENSGHAVCEFCLNLLENCCFTALGIDENVLPEKTMLAKYFPELDLSISKKLVICDVCHGSLVNFFSFITISSIVEGQIKEYCEAEGVINTDLIKLNDILQLTLENFLMEDDNKVDVFKMEDAISVKSENEIMEIQEGMCTLCLEKCENFKAMDGNTRNILDILLPKIDFTVIQGPVMCQNCEEMLTKWFDFKATCLHTQNYIVPFLDNKNEVKVDLKDVYLSKNVTGTDISEDQDICGFCMGLVKNCSVVSLDAEEGDVILKKMIEQCLPELDLSIIKKPVICSSCHGSLEDCFYFAMNCLIAGEKIKKYCETTDINSKGQIELNISLQPTIRGVTTKEATGNSTDVIKAEGQLCENRKIPDEKEIGNGGGTVKLEQIFIIDSEDAIKDVKKKNNFMEMNDQEVNNEQQFTRKNMLACAGECNKLGAIKIEEIFCGENEIKHEDENLVEMEDRTFLPNEEIEIKTDEHDFNRFDDGIVLLQSEVTRRLHREEKCEKRIKSLINHNLILESFKKRLLLHQDPSEVTIYKCDYCAFETKNRDYLKDHLLTHKDPSEVAIYKCEFCSFQTKHKKYLQVHLLTHKDSSEVIMYKCNFCLYQAKFKSYLRKHLRLHKNPSELTMYKCAYCSFESKHSLKSHLLKHKDPSEVTMYKCDYCSFETKHKDSLKCHLLMHKDPSEVTMYKCDHCSFQTKRKHHLKHHLLTHKDSSEITMYKCVYCSFQTKYKDNIKNHLLKHRDPSEVTMYKCDTCSFQTKVKYSLKNHLILHKNPSEVEMYKCNFCSFQTKRKGSLKDHLLTHKDPSEVTMHKCVSCAYQTKRKRDIKKHMVLHKTP